MIGGLCLALLDARGCPCALLLVMRARRNTLLGRKKAGLRESNVSLIQLSYMAQLITRDTLRCFIFSRPIAICRHIPLLAKVVVQPFLLCASELCSSSPCLTHSAFFAHTVAPLPTILFSLSTPRPPTLHSRFLPNLFFCLPSRT